MASLRNSLPRRTHWERAQPKERQRLGLLEKKKDYKQRAVDHNKKERRLRALKEKAALKNPDEFYHGMEHTTIHDPLRAQGSVKVTEEILRAKTRDAAFLSQQANRDSRRAEKLRGELHGLSLNGTGVGRQHTIFVDSEEALDDFDPVQHFGTTSEFVGRAHNRVRQEDLDRKDLILAGADADRKSLRRGRKEVDRRRREMEERVTRAQKLRNMATQVEVQKALLQKGRRVKVAEGDKQRGTGPVYRWCKERKR